MSSSESRGSSGWFWWFLLLGPIALVLWWWLCPRRQCKPALLRSYCPTDEGFEENIPIATAAAPPVADEKKEEAEEESASEPSPDPDDLKRIEGIGPKIAGIFNDAGIIAFAQLAASDVEELREILVSGGLRGIANPATWPEQAALAAAEKWDELTSLQQSLKGGRRA